MADEIAFTINGIGYTLSKNEVLEKLNGVRPGPVKKYSVRVRNFDYPLKQALSAVLGLSPMHFSTLYAHSIFRRLGFQIKES